MTANGEVTNSNCRPFDGAGRGHRDWLTQDDNAVGSAKRDYHRYAEITKSNRRCFAPLSMTAQEGNSKQQGDCGLRNIISIAAGLFTLSAAPDFNQDDNA
jgi:hypothetical protein